MFNHEKVSNQSFWALSQRSKIRFGEHTISDDGPDCGQIWDWKTQKKVSDPNHCNAGVQDFDVDKIVFHQSYNKPDVYKNDIAIIKLKGRIDENGNKFIMEPFALT